MELKAKLTDSRARDHVQLLEENCLQHVRVQHVIVKWHGNRKCKGKKRKFVEVEEDDDEFV